MSRSTSWCCSARVAVATTTRSLLQQRRDEVAERLAGAGAGLDEQVATLGHRRGDGLGHRDLAGSLLATELVHRGLEDLTNARLLDHPSTLCGAPDSSSRGCTGTTIVTGVTVAIMTREITTVLSERSYLECPRWHDGRLWVVDFYTYEVLSLLEDGTDVRLEAPSRSSRRAWAGCPTGDCSWCPCATRRSCVASTTANSSSTPTSQPMSPATRTTWWSTPRVVPTSATSAST